MGNANYELLEHTADVAILVRAKSLKELFVNTAVAMFEIIADPVFDKQGQRVTASVSQNAAGREELLVNWLNELLFFSTSQEAVFRDFKIVSLDERSVRAEIFGLPFSSCEIHIEIKAATFHELSISGQGEVWQAKVVFDV
ncbi:MAG: archease [Candidatus Omnitrophica bacterium]|jgi:SHS2 domain-containing protein|nr:archease [Candidatus Omnitrophota bacterium]MDD3982483.1 archease [Candidatus Omnitrophota bacterium]MDD5526902.1 archease [Candidatus Omnitrophota bacterium]